MFLDVRFPPNEKNRASAFMEFVDVSPSMGRLLKRQVGAGSEANLFALAPRRRYLDHLSPMGDRGPQAHLG